MPETLEIGRLLHREDGLKMVSEIEMQEGRLLALALLVLALALLVLAPAVLALALAMLETLEICRLLPREEELETVLAKEIQEGRMLALATIETPEICRLLR